MATTAHAVKQMSRFGEVRVERNFRYVTVGQYVVSIIDQDGTALNFHVRRETEHDDLQSDYFAGSYAKNITQALRWASTW